MPTSGKLGLPPNEVHENSLGHQHLLLRAWRDRLSRVSRPRKTDSGRARPNVYGLVPSVPSIPTEESPRDNQFCTATGSAFNREGVLAVLKYDPHKSPHSPAEELNLRRCFCLVGV